MNEQEELQEHEFIDVNQFQATLGYHFKNTDLLTRALTHSSYTNENAEVDYSNERLEFLGDAVLELIICHHLFTTYPKCREGNLTKYKSIVVNEYSLARIARSISLGNYLYLGKGERLSGGRDKPSILADTFEALIAAVYLDAGLKRTTEFVLTQFAPLLDNLSESDPPLDHKSRLQEFIQLKFKVVPKYKTLDEYGPDHDKRFIVGVFLHGKILTKAQGRSKKEAEQRAARDAMTLLHTEEQVGEEPPES